jgi:hypothetical protein
MTDYSPIPAELRTPESDGAALPCPNFTVFGKENFTKNINGKVAVIVNTYESIVAASSLSMAGGRRTDPTEALRAKP